MDWWGQVFKKFCPKLSWSFKLGGCYTNILSWVLICCILNYSRVLEEVNRCRMVIWLKLYIELSCSTTLHWGGLHHFHFHFHFHFFFNNNFNLIWITYGDNLLGPKDPHIYYCLTQHSCDMKQKSLNKKKTRMVFQQQIRFNKEFLLDLGFPTWLWVFSPEQELKRIN